MNPRFPGQQNFFAYPQRYGYQPPPVNQQYARNQGPYFYFSQQLPFANANYTDFSQVSLPSQYPQLNYNANRGHMHKRQRGGREFHSQKRSRDYSQEESHKRQKLHLRYSDESRDSSLNEQITESIWRYYENYRQSNEAYRRKVDLRDALYAIFKDIFPYCGLYMVGSSMSGFATKTSDMDLCLMISPEEMDGKKEAVEILMAIQRSLRNCSFHRRSQLIRAKVPILKFEDPQSGVECDLNINNSVGIRNTHLLRCYATMDWRVRPLVLFVKKWARFHDINDASKKTISSYSLCLMVIHFLQCGTEPPVLESIQKLNPMRHGKCPVFYLNPCSANGYLSFTNSLDPDKKQSNSETYQDPNSMTLNHQFLKCLNELQTLFDYGEDIRNLKMNIDLNFKSKNSQSLGDLFHGFLEYYTLHFNFLYDVASVRQGTKLPINMVKMMTNNLSQWGCLKIEEPFDFSNTARSCFDPVTFMRVRRVITKSYNLLSSSRNVNAILSAPF